MGADQSKLDLTKGIDIDTNIDITYGFDHVNNKFCNMEYFNNIATGQLLSGQGLNQDGRIYSPSGEYYLTIKNDGNLVHYKMNDKNDPNGGATAVWEAGIPDCRYPPKLFGEVIFHGPFKLIMSEGGNLCYCYGNQKSLKLYIGLTNTDGHEGALLAVTDWGDIIVYGRGKVNDVLWNLAAHLDLK